MTKILHKEQRLKNGMRVVYVPMRNNTDVVSINMVYDVGSKDEKIGQTGIAHMLEHMSFKSTKTLKAGEFDEIVKGFGGVNNAMTSFDYTQYFIKATSEHFSSCLDLFKSMMCELSLKEKEFKSEQKVVLEERFLTTQNSPFGFLFFSLFNNIYDYLPYHWTPIGFTQDIENFTTKKLKKFYQKHYHPQNATLLVCGDIDEDVVFGTADDVFAGLKPKKTKKSKKQTEPKIDAFKEVMLSYEHELDLLCMAFRIPSHSSADIVAFEAIAYLLSDSKTSILNEQLINKQNLVAQIQSYPMPLSKDGVFVIMAMCNDGVRAEVVHKKIMNILQGLKTKKISDASLKKIKANLRFSFSSSMTSSMRLAMLYSEYIVRDNLGYLEGYAQAVEDLSKDDIMDALNKYFNKNTQTKIILRKDL